MGFIGAEHLRAGQVVVDVGIHVNEEGRLCGDVRFGEAEPVVEPSPLSPAASAP